MLSKFGQIEKSIHLEYGLFLHYKYMSRFWQQGITKLRHLDAYTAFYWWPANMLASKDRISGMSKAEVYVSL